MDHPADHNALIAWERYYQASPADERGVFRAGHRATYDTAFEAGKTSGRAEMWEQSANNHREMMRRIDLVFDECADVKRQNSELLVKLSIAEHAAACLSEDVKQLRAEIHEYREERRKRSESPNGQ